MNKTFDWQAFLAARIPSNEPTATQLQKNRQALLDTQLLPNLQAWARQRQLIPIWGGDLSDSRKKIFICAHYGATTASGFYQYPQAWLLTRFSFWVFALDRYLDDTLLSYLSRQHWSLEEKFAYLDEELADLGEPLSLLDGQTVQQARSALLPLRQPEPGRHFPCNGANQPSFVAEQHRASLKRALIDISESLLQILSETSEDEEIPATEATPYANCPSRPERSNIFALKTFTREMATCLSSMHSELMASLSFHLTGELPPAQSKRGNPSISLCFQKLLDAPSLLDLGWEDYSMEIENWQVFGCQASGKSIPFHPFLGNS